jgi:hypothetical protein
MSEKVTNDIFVVRQEMRSGWTYNVVLVFREDAIGVVDTGYENTPEDYVFHLIARALRIG